MRTDYLTPEEAKRFIEVCDDDFRNMVLGALYTGCRYGELCTLRVDAYDSHIHAIKVLQGKTKRLKILYLSNDEVAFFDEQVKGKKSADFMFVQKRWNRMEKGSSARTHEGCLRRCEDHETYHIPQPAPYVWIVAWQWAERVANWYRSRWGIARGARMTDRYTHFEQSWGARNHPQQQTVIWLRRTGAGTRDKDRLIHRTQLTTYRACIAPSDAGSFL